MFLYNQEKDQLVIYAFNGKSTEIKNYKIYQIDKMRQEDSEVNKNQLFYTLIANHEFFIRKNQWVNISDNHEESYLYTTDSWYLREPVAIKYRDDYQKDINEENKTLIENYLFNQGKIITINNNGYFSNTNNKKLINNYQVFKLLKLSSQLLSLWYLEHGNFQCPLYQEITSLFELTPIKQYPMNEIKELQKYQLISSITINNDEIEKLKKYK